MMARIHKSLDEKEKGFTLIELLVVIIIIGILAAIAIPVFLNQREKGWDAAIKSDLKNAATAQETYLTDVGSYVDGAISDDVSVTTNLGPSGFNFSAAGNYDGTIGVVMNSVADAGISYCMDATSASGQIWVYDSELGGLQPNTATACA